MADRSCRCPLTILLLVVIACAAQRAEATFHLWQVEEIYSDAGGKLQYIEFTSSFGGQQFLSGHELQASQSGSTHTHLLQNDLPGDSADRHFLVGSQSFADLGVISPDYVVPDGFLFLSNASVSIPGGDFVSYAALPADGIHAIGRNGQPVVNSPTNFAGQTASVPLLPTTGLWAIDAEVNGQPGRGFTIEVQGGNLVLTVFGYAANGDNSFFQAAGPIKNGAIDATLNTYQGGTAFGSPFSAATLAGAAGPVTLTFTDAGHGTVVFPGEAGRAISKFNWSAAANTASVVPASGLWAIDAEVNGQPGRGFTIEVEGNVLVLTVFGYASGGAGAFYQAAADLTNAPFHAPLDFYKNGTHFGGPFQAASRVGSAGDVTMTFSDSTHGSVQFPGEPAKAMSKFHW